MNRFYKALIWAMIVALVALAAFGIVRVEQRRRIETVQPVYEAAQTIAPEEMTAVG